MVTVTNIEGGHPCPPPGKRFAGLTIPRPFGARFADIISYSFIPRFAQYTTRPFGARFAGLFFLILILILKIFKLLYNIL